MIRAPRRTIPVQFAHFFPWISALTVVQCATPPFRVAGWRCGMDEDFITLEVEEEGCGRLQFELPLDITDEEIAYLKSLVPRVDSGLLELLDPDTGEVVFCCTPVLVH